MLRRRGFVVDIAADGLQAVAAPRSGAPRRGLHGLPDAEPRRLRGDRADPRRRARRPPRPDRRDDRPRVRGRPRALPARRDGRLPQQAAARRGPRSRARALARRRRRRRRADRRAGRPRAHPQPAHVGEAWSRSSSTSFARTTPPLLDELRAAVERGEETTVRQLAHKLRGSSETVGAAAALRARPPARARRGRWRGRRAAAAGLRAARSRSCSGWASAGPARAACGSRVCRGASRTRARSRCRSGRTACRSTSRPELWSV